MVQFIIGLVIGVFIGGFIAVYTMGHITINLQSPVDLRELLEMWEDVEYGEDDYDEDDDDEDDDEN